MGYQLGVDLGTTYTAAAVGRNGRGEVATLGASGPVMPSVVLLRADGEVLVGEVAVRRGIVEPTRVAREFKRRLGDTTPLVLGGTPYGAEALMAYLLREVVRIVSEREGEPPERVVLTHPANYGPYKADMMREVARLAGLELERVTFLTEPQAAAISYASRNRVEPGEVVAVYDFGGGTFDAALVRRSGEGFALIGRPEGMERFGGIDIDAALVAHVDNVLGGAISALDPADVAVQAGVARLRDECRAAKEALSGDTDASVAVSLPNVQTTVAISRADLENMIRPRLSDTVDAVKRAVASAGVDMDGVSRILLVGGSSRIPLVADAIRRETGRPVALDAHPKFAICLGAAVLGQVAAAADGPGGPPPPPPPPAAGADNAPPPPPSPGAPDAPDAPAAAASSGLPRPNSTGGPASPATGMSSSGVAPFAVSGSGAPPRNRTKVVALAAAAAAILAVIGFVAFRGSGDSKAAVVTDETARPRRTFPDDSTVTSAVTNPPVTVPVTEVAPSTLPSTALPTTPGTVAITGDQLRAAMVTANELEPGWTDSSPDNNGDDLCGQFPANQPVTRNAVAFDRVNAAAVDQFLVNQVEVYRSAAEANAQFESTLGVVFNCTDGSQVINGITVKETMTALRASSEVMAGFPGCEKASSVLVHAEAPDVSFNNQLNIWFMQCGNTLVTVSLSEPFGSNLTASAQAVAVAVAASHAKVTKLPLVH